MAPKSTIMILCRFEQPNFFLLGLSWIVSAGSTNVESALDVQRPDRLETSAYYKWSTSTSNLFSYTHIDLQPTLESLKQVTHCVIALPLMPSWNFKLKTSLTGCKTTSHLNDCTFMEHAHPSYAARVLQIWLTYLVNFEPKCYAQILG
jgi:hypothetical protein